MSILKLILSFANLQKPDSITHSLRAHIRQGIS